MVDLWNYLLDPSSHINNSETDHSTMNHGTMDHGAVDHGAMGHGMMDHSTMDHGTMDHGTMDHSTHASSNKDMDMCGMSHGMMMHNLKKAWNKLPPEERNETPELNETDDNPDNDFEEIVEMFSSIPGFSECDREDTESWLQNDIDDPGYQIMNEDEIVSYLQDRDEMSEDEEDECGKIPSEHESGPSNKAAHTALFTAMT
ncbi:unnamed protein product [Timema podura]|uniref:Uncharacterized protein n=1 Tax=Timema podura TaxID=61482 RepID=A0ABN7NR30_TIMPD|nr:unnamed protein product [Timema podura]